MPGYYETDLSAQYPQTQAQTRVSQANVVEGGPQSAQSQARQGPEAACRLAPLCSAAMTKPLGFPKEIRLRLKREIESVFRNGRYDVLGILHAKSLPTAREEARFLISVKKAVGSAPHRNRIKRLVREAIRLNRHGLRGPHDICLFLTKEPRRPPEFATIEAEIRKLFDRLSKPR